MAASPTRSRPLRFQNHSAPYASGSTLIEWGNTRVICGVNIEESVPRWMKEQNVVGGWITAEYAMLPYSTLTRKPATHHKGRLRWQPAADPGACIGRAMRAAQTLEKLSAHSPSAWIATSCCGGRRRSCPPPSPVPFVALSLAIRGYWRPGKISGSQIRPFRRRRRHKTS